MKKEVDTTSVLLISLGIVIILFYLFIMEITTIQVSLGLIFGGVGVKILNLLGVK